MNKILALFVGFLSITAFSQTRLNGLNLLEEDAAFRSAHVSNVSYELSFDLRGEKTFSGSSKMQFELKELPQFLTVDFVEGDVKSIELNGKALDPASHNGSLILLKQENLLVGKNTLSVAYTHAYSNNGSGLYRFVDPEDQKVYLYTHFEPYDANRLFPCFDQPDLKATYKLSVVAPKDWTVVTSIRESSKKLNPKTGAQQWEFPESKKFSTYIFSLIAGPYKIWEKTKGEVPLRLMARQSFAKFVKPEFWFTITNQGFEFFKNYFGTAYPFVKYDQIIVPDFNAGAMENVAAVTFSERLIKRGNYTRTNNFDIANVLLHEMSHQWFGNLVTMKWWGDLWLNETFATYMASLALEQATEFKESWRVFASSDKAWASFEDQMPTTHPIRASVPDTMSTFTNFDGITYSKGAAVMKQISFVLGEKSFQSGLKNYFETHAYQNATFSDFVRSLEKASQVSLQKLSSEWIETAGLNTVKSEWSCEGGKLSKINLIQGLTQKDFPTLREHKSVLAFFAAPSQSGAPRLIKQQEVTYSGSSTRINLSPAIECPAFVYPNFLDQDYVQVNFDPSSLDFLTKHLSRFQGSADLDLLRNSLWQNVWEETRNARLSLGSFLRIATTHLPQEKETSTLKEVLDNLDSVVNFAPKESNKQNELAAQVEKYLKNAFLNASPGSDSQQIYFDTYISTYWNAAQTSELSRLLKQNQAAKGLNWDPDLRWKSIQSICREKSDCSSLIQAEKQRDKSQNGKIASLAAEAAQNNLKKKKKVYSEILDGKRKFAELRSFMRNLWPWNQVSLQDEFKKTYFEDLIKLQEKNEEGLTSGFARHVLPFECGEKDLPVLKTFLEQKSTALRPEALKPLKISQRIFEKCADIQKLTLKETPSSIQ